MFKSLLIANRGEIACRVIQTAKKLNIKTIAIYSNADKNSIHTFQADEAYPLHSDIPSESYLDIDKIIKIAKHAGAEAIHPGYGFLSENTKFSESCSKNNICFIGPTPDVIKKMGEKNIAKELAEKSGLPLLPGYHGSNQDPDFLLNEAKEIGMPLLIKASAGGGGKGMRIVENIEDFIENLNSAKREAKSSFGNDHVILERYIQNPRHIEIQIMADKYGHACHFFERDCSIQRRYQKIVEETPAPNLDPKLRDQIANAAVQLAIDIDYVGAGTVEFILDTDRQKDNFYFMEMNTRLQVEHPITEKITNTDLVELQLKIAYGEKLAIKEVETDGASFEVRLYAENPQHNFLPSTGMLKELKFPEENDFLRIDTGFQQNDEVTPLYDPMMAKIITWGHNRKHALNNLIQSLKKTYIVGVKTNRDFLIDVLQQSQFQEGHYTTNFIKDHETVLLSDKSHDIPDHILSLSALILFNEKNQKGFNPWTYLRGWRLNEIKKYDFNIVYGDQNYSISLFPTDIPEAFDTVINNKKGPSIHQKNIQNYHYLYDNGDLTLFDTEGKTYLIKEKQLFTINQAQENTQNEFTAPMPGRITAVFVSSGQDVKQGTPLISLEAMKMEHTVRAPYHGQVKLVHYKVGDQVNEGDDLIDFETSPDTGGDSQDEAA